MSFQVDLSPETEIRIYEEATRQGMDAPDFVRQLIETSLPAPAAPVLTEKQKTYFWQALWFAPSYFTS